MDMAIVHGWEGYESYLGWRSGSIFIDFWELGVVSQARRQFPWGRLNLKRMISFGEGHSQLQTWGGGVGMSSIPLFRFLQHAFRHNFCMFLHRVAWSNNCATSHETQSLPQLEFGVFGLKFVKTEHYQSQLNPVWGGAVRRQLMNGCSAGWLSPQQSPAAWHAWLDKSGLPTGSLHSLSSTCVLLTFVLLGNDLELHI